MKSTRHRLDRFIRQNMQLSLREIRSLLVNKRILVDNETATDMSQLVTQFSTVSVDGKVIKNNSPIYLMLNKPKGVVCATKDQHHTTVLDLVQDPRKSELHIAGRLDFNSSGLVLLTNDGHWSRRLSSPAHGVNKHYAVTLEKPLTQDYIEVFEKGIYFPYEKITTRPCQLTILGEYYAVLSLTEGRYHQIKRMFGAFQNKVLELHRFAVGSLVMEKTLRPGMCRPLSSQEKTTIFQP